MERKRKKEEEEEKQRLKEEKQRLKEEKQRLKEEQEMKRIRENPRQYMKKVQRLTKENEFLKCDNNSLTQKIERFENALRFEVELKQKVKYYKDKLHSALKMMTDSMREDLKRTGSLEEKKSILTDTNSTPKCNFCGENQRMDQSIKEKFEAMNDEYQIIRKFTKIRAGEKKKSRKVK